MLIHTLAAVSALAVLGNAAWSQTPSTTLSFAVASVKASERRVGPDFNDQIEFSAVGLRARNVTLRRLIAEAYNVQPLQVLGERWLQESEYNIEAQSESAVTKEELMLMLRSLLTERFGLRCHTETRNMRAYELTADKAGPKIQPVKAGDKPAPGSGFHFSGTMRQLADLIAIQLTIPTPTTATGPAMASNNPVPVLDKTELSGLYDFRVDTRPELDTDGFTSWKRVLEEQLGLKLNSRRVDVSVIVVDNALRIPTPN